MEKSSVKISFKSTKEKYYIDIFVPHYTDFFTKLFKL